jgi:hypothetical protein
MMGLTYGNRFLILNNINFGNYFKIWILHLFTKCLQAQLKLILENERGISSLYLGLKPHCIQSSRVLVPTGTSKSMSRRYRIHAITRVMAYVADAATLWRCLQQCVLTG